MDAISGSGLQCVQMRGLSWENVKGLRHLLSGGKGYFEEPIVNVIECISVKFWLISKVFH